MHTPVAQALLAEYSVVPLGMTTEVDTRYTTSAGWRGHVYFIYRPIREETQ